MPAGAFPPLPPGGDASASPSPSPAQPSMMQLSGMQTGQTMQQTAGMSQVSETVVRMAAEIDQALKLLSQALPPLSPWVEKTVMELRQQIGTALQGGMQPTNPTPADSQRFPDGGGRV